MPARKTARSRSGSVAVVRELLRAGHVDLGELLADVARAGVEHEPDGLVGVEAELDEVVAAAERAELQLGAADEALHLLA